jgi:hypothetical protein
MPYGIRLQRTTFLQVRHSAEIKHARASIYNTTLIYAEIPTEELREQVNSVSHHL